MANERVGGCAESDMKVYSTSLILITFKPVTSEVNSVWSPGQTAQIHRDAKKRTKN